MSNLFRLLPSVDVCLDDWLSSHFNAEQTPRQLLKVLVNDYLDSLRHNIRSGVLTDAEVLRPEALSASLLDFVRQELKPRFRRVINATGVVLHTNMGRSVLAEEALQAINAVCQGYSNLELDLTTGKRGSRYSHVVSLLRKLTGAEDAMVVNNNAAAVFLTLDALCRDKEVVVARGQLVEIGGSFRIPDVMSRSGATLREVGCTNRVHPEDYLAAITTETAALMRVHTSNFRVVGFHSDVSVDTLAALAHEHNLLLIEDLGSGSLVDLTVCGLPDEPTVQSVVAAGADVVTFSGDKVLGGPQAGIIVGTTEALAAIRRHPLNRALRIDKMTLAALEATLRLYIAPETAKKRVPTLRMILTPPEELQRRATRLARRLRQQLGDTVRIDTCPGTSRVGGGSFPEYDLPGTLVRVLPRTMTVEDLRQRLLATDPPVVGRVEDNALCLDPRTLTQLEEVLVADALSQSLL